MIGGRDVEETTDGRDTTRTWNKVYDLGTQKHPGDASGGDPRPTTTRTTSSRRVDVQSVTPPARTRRPARTTQGLHLHAAAPTRARPERPRRWPTAPFVAGHLRRPPVHDRPERRRRGDDDRASPGTTAEPTTGTSTSTARTADGDADSRSAARRAAARPPRRSRCPNPAPGDYVVRVVELRRGRAPTTLKVDVHAAARGAERRATTRRAAYVGFCGYCDTITQGTPFANGIATNVGGDKPGKAGAARRLAHRQGRRACRAATSRRSGWTRRTRARST